MWEYLQKVWKVHKKRKVLAAIVNCSDMTSFLLSLMFFRIVRKKNSKKQNEHTSSPANYTPWLHFLHEDVDFSQILTSKGHHTESKASSWGPFYIYVFNLSALMKGDIKKVN